METEKYVSFKERIVENCSKVIFGKNEYIELAIVCCLCSGHLLLEDVPGTGKTMLFRAFAKSIGGSFTRIQFTPDVMPSDITGINFYNMKQGEFEFRPGPLFANMVLADEINRATPRTQSSLLEAMAEGQISIDGTTYPVPSPFMIAATQNPIESYGTFPLPEAQLDRFMMRFALGYMKRGEELAVAKGRDSSAKTEELDAVVTSDELINLRRTLSQIELAAPVAEYIMDIIERTRTDKRLKLGASARGTIALHRASRAYAAINGRSFVTPEDVRYLAPFILPHRLHFRSNVQSGEARDSFIELMNEIQTPLERQ